MKLSLATYVMDFCKRMFGWPGVFAVLIIVRLYLTGDRDILALNAPYDEFWFVDAAARHIWGGAYNHRSFAQLPIYPIWLWLIELFGIPARLALDLAWIGASACLARAVFAVTARVWPALLLFAFLLFHPLSVIVFDRALAETLLTVLSAFTLALGIEIWMRRNLVTRKTTLLSLIYAVSFALAFHTRKEGVVLFAPIVLLAIFWVFQRKHWRVTLAGNARAAAALVVYPLISTLVLGTALAGANYVHWGVFARYDLAASGYLRTMAALAAIDNGPTPHDVTITASTRALAYQQSPTFRELEPYFEGQDGRNMAAYTAQFTGIPGEIGNGWFYWAIREFAARAGWHKSAEFANSKYSAVATELDAAFKSGRLKKRAMVLSGFVDPDYGKWIADVPVAVFNEARLTGRPRYDYFRAPDENATPRQFQEYVQMLGRRKLPPPTVVSGWIVAPATDTIGLEQPGERTRWTELGTTPRPDVPGALPFSLEAFGYPASDALLVRDRDGKLGRVALVALTQGAMSATEGSLQLTLGVDRVDRPADLSRLDRLFSHLGEPGGQVEWVAALDLIYGWIGTAFWVAAAGAALILGASRNTSTAFGLLALCASAVLSRCMVLGLLDASSWSGLQARYVMPAIPLFGCMGVIGLAVVVETVRNRAFKSRSA